ncbi:asparagine synthase-related protein [Streptomyces afghaniensis]|uniref:asparagine synthase-related protein n=1 Tax=Streptomyces afghaniensis TaxID=66865 RepID=UPI0027D78F39|nr:asparagine synthase-related protein [Streptomyces afghaniensis]
MLPLFQDGAGRTSADPLTLAGPAPVVDLQALALLLAPPALLGEFVPRSPWKDVERVPAQIPHPLPGSLARAFTRAVEAQTADAEVIGVLVSGGLDSLAVLVHAVRAAAGRRVIAFTTDLTDDAGGSAAAVVRRLLAALELPAELVVLDPARDRAEPVWSPAGPRLDALPEVNAAAAERAAELGCGVLLSGDGADELLGVPRYATAAVAYRRGVRPAARYAADVAASGPGLAGEVAGAAAGLLPRGPRARAYWAANWPAWCDPVAPAVLAEPYRSAATAWAREWVDAQVAAHAAAGRSWAEADAHDAAFPREAIPPAGPVAEASPFLHEAFLAAALALPLGDRYHPVLPSPYLRCKAQVVRLLPAAALEVLARRKQYFKTALATASAAGSRAPRCVEAGLLDGDALAAETDPAVLLVVAALERWLAGAEKYCPRLIRPKQGGAAAE